MTTPRHRPLLLALVVGCCITWPALAVGQSLDAAAPQADRVSAQVRGLTGRDLAAIESLYNTARDLQETVARIPPAPARCQRAVGWLTRFAANAVNSAEGYDRLEPARAQRSRAAALSAYAAWKTARPACPSGTNWPARRSGYITPQPDAASFGHVSAVLPAGADTAVVSIDGQRVGRLPVGSGRAQGRIVGPAGKHTVRVEFLRRNRAVAAVTSRNVWLLPGTAARQAQPRNDPALTSRLARAGSAFDGSAAVWTEDLTTGRAGSWNAGARFPAASTVKLGVMVRAARACSGNVAACRYAYDIRAIGAWSSNLAANRLLRNFGATSIMRSLQSMGATSSTYPGGYQVATERPPVTVTDQPALSTRRVTTAADLAAVLRHIHGAALGKSESAQATGLTRTQALAVLGALLSSERTGENIGVLNPGIPASTPVAQKQGWVSSARHTAAIVYRDTGPQLVVVLTARPGISLASSQRFGQQILATAQ